MILTTHKLIVVTPVFEDLHSCNQLLQELAKQFEGRLFVLAIDDGSLRSPLTTYGMEAANIDGTVLQLRRNVGHQKAIAIGLNYITNKLTPDQYVVVMDCDGEDLPSTIPELLQLVQGLDIDVSVAHRKSRMESRKFKIFYYLYKFFFRLVTGRVISFGNFMVLKPAAVARLSVMPELSLHVAAAVIASRLRIGVCPVDRGLRYVGRSKMNFIGLVLHGFKAIMVFAEDVLVRVGLTSAVIASLAMVGGFAALVLKIVGYATPGWFSVVLGILMLLFLQTGMLSLMALMLTGVMRSGHMTSTPSYSDYVAAVLETRNRVKGS